jgi:hypothetical protein
MLSARLQDVTFKLGFSNPDVIANALDWKNVDAVLQHSAFSDLRNVYFRQLSSVAHTRIVQHLPRCHARGILRVEAVDHWQYSFLPRVGTRLQW